MVMFQWLCVRAHAQITVSVHLASLGAKDGSPYETAARFSMEAARLEMCLEGSGGAEFLLDLGSVPRLTLLLHSV
jgi:hypothetical protein